MAGVSTTHKAYDAMTEQWSRCRDTTSGSDAVKAAGKKYLPPLDSHKKSDGAGKYQEYVLRALFYNATGRTVAGLAGGIFQKAPELTAVDGPAKEHCKDVTLTGEPIDMFALNVTMEYLTTGRYGILIDMASEEAVTLRPYWVGYCAEDIINWRFEDMGGDQELSLVVLREQIATPKPDDEFDVAVGVRYRVLRLTKGIYTQQVYTKAPSAPGESEEKYIGGEILTPSRKGVPLDFIPFALPWTVANPPLIDLVDVNLSHYRGSADLKHGLHFTALPTPWVSGQAGAGDKALSIGSGTAWSLDKDGKAGMLEFTGRGLGAIRTDLRDMQLMMASLGARLIEPAPTSRETALSVAVRHSSDFATLRVIAQVVEQQISWALKVHVWWLGSEPLVASIKSEIVLNKIFIDQQLTADELRALLLALQSNSISYKTFYSRLSMAGWMREGVSDEEEIQDMRDQPEMIGVAPLIAELPGAGSPGGAPKPTPVGGAPARPALKPKVK